MLLHDTIHLNSTVEKSFALQSALDCAWRRTNQDNARRPYVKSVRLTGNGRSSDSFVLINIQFLCWICPDSEDQIVTAVVLFVFSLRSFSLCPFAEESSHSRWPTADLALSPARQLSSLPSVLGRRKKTRKAESDRIKWSNLSWSSRSDTCSTNSLFNLWTKQDCYFQSHAF